MPDNRKNNGGARKGAGRKSVADEEKVKNLAISAMIDEFGGEAEAWKHLAQQAKKDRHHFRLLFEYAYGKPKESVAVDLTGDVNIAFNDV